ncbi:MAG: TIGR01777 family protein [Verrucomicrobia bacterium]|nr:MAG: TIGR01777 family protein [Verrucomicrobiota bacterium]
MNILVTGASGLIGAAIAEHLTRDGHSVLALKRGKNETLPRWDPESEKIELDGIPPLDAVIHLAGENVAGRWTAKKKRRIRDSRVQGTRLLCETVSRLPRRPQVLLSASAVGFYGDRGNETLDERSTSGGGFLAEVCREWEAATLPAAQRGIRVVNLRFGIVLTPAGGALKAMLVPLRLGLGGRIGSGRQYWSWIALSDVVRAARHGLLSESLRGPVNVVASQSITNREFIRTLGRVLRRPTCFPMPAFVARTLFGQAADELLLASAQVAPKRLRESGFHFEHPDLEPALRCLLNP